MSDKKILNAFVAEAPRTYSVHLDQGQRYIERGGKANEEHLKGSSIKILDT